MIVKHSSTTLTRVIGPLVMDASTGHARVEGARVTITIESSDDDARERFEKRARDFLERELGE